MCCASASKGELQAARDWVEEEQLEIKCAVEEESEDLSEVDYDPTTWEGVIRNCRNLMIINYFTEEDEVSICFEDEAGLFGVDVTVETDLAFSTVEAATDG